MAKKANGTARIELDILNPEKFRTLKEIQDFVTGEGAKALHFAIGEVLNPELDPLDMRYLGDSLKEARRGAFWLNEDLEHLARAAVELEDDVQFTASRGCATDVDGLPLMIISLKNHDVSDWVKREIIDHLGGSDCSSEAGQETAHACPQEHPSATDAKTEPDEEIGPEEPNDLTELAILPLPGGGTVTPETALAWLRDEFGPFLTVVCNVASLGSTKDVRESASFLGIDLHVAHEACVRAITTQTSQSFERDDRQNDWDDSTLTLAQVCAGREVMGGSEGPFEWAFDELAEELARRLGSGPEAAEANDNDGNSRAEVGVIESLQAEDARLDERRARLSEEFDEILRRGSEIRSEILVANSWWGRPCLTPEAASPRPPHRARPRRDRRACPGERVGDVPRSAAGVGGGGAAVAESGA